MLFNSIEFLLFFVLVVAIYFTIPHKYRWVLLLLSSYYFYMSWKPEYIILIMFSTLINYITGIQIYLANTPNRKKFFLGLSIFSNIGMLFAFKYFNFFSEAITEIVKQFSIQLQPLTLKLLLPVGISYYTFQCLSYTIDIYRGQLQPERHVGIFAVYVSFFPKLVAGPIERATNLLPQFFEKQYFDYNRVTGGLKLMLWGFFKKAVIADRLALTVNMVFNNVHDYNGMSLILATFFFAFQIYCDFSGYSDIAIGSAQVLGIRLADNFNRPYFSRSISEFWKRWHISLYSWFKDYLYIPLGGNRVSVPRWYANILIVFVVSGLWHGANWTFVVWGALHGFYLIFEIITAPLKNTVLQLSGVARFPKVIQFIEIAFTFILVSMGWIFFRANSLSEAFYVFTHMLEGLSLSLPRDLGLGWISFMYILGMIAFMEIIQALQGPAHLRQFLSDKPTLFRWLIYAALIMLILLFGVFDEKEFIYSQF